MPFWAGFIAMEPAGAAVEGLPDFDDESLVREGAEAKGGDGRAVDRGDRGVDGGGEMHGGRVIDIIHVCFFHQGGGLKEAKGSAEIDRFWMRDFYFFAELAVGGRAEEVDGVALRKVLEEGGPFFFWILLGEPDGRGGDGNIGFGLIGSDFFFIACRRIKVGFGRLVVGECSDKGLVPFDLVAVIDDMGDLFSEKEAQRIFVKADRLFCAGEDGEEAGGGESLNIDHGIVLCSADASCEAPEVLDFMFALVPDEDFVEEGVANEQGFVAFSYQEIDPGVGIEGVEFFDEGGGEDNVTDKRRLYDEDFLHGCKITAFQGRMTVTVPSGFHFMIEEG
jgi:hypothetical protein